MGVSARPPSAVVLLFLDGLIPLQVPELSSRATLQLWVDRALASLCEGLGPRR